MHHSAVPRFATDLPPGTPTFGPAIVATAAALGRTLMPWQVHAADVIGATTDDGARMLFPFVVVHVPRRAGKSAVTFGSLLHRTFTGPGVQCWYTAQTREAAAKTFRKDWVPLLARSPWITSGALTLRRSNGSEEVGVPRLGSAVNLFAPGPTALHGSDADAVCVDEAWSFTLDAGSDIESGVQPAQLTRPRRQLLIVSAGGTADSAWLERWITLARDGTPGVALIDYGADPDDDPDDPDVWRRVHPAIGHTIGVEAIAAMRATIPEHEFLRSVLGVWTPRGTVSAVIPYALWVTPTSEGGVLDPDAVPPARGLAYGVETNHAGTRTTFAAASVDGDGRVVAELVDECAPSEAVGRWRALRSAHRGRLFADSLGPTGPVVDALSRAGLGPVVLTTGQYATACAALLDDVRTPGRFAHRGQPGLDAAVRAATARRLGDRWVWDRRSDAADVAPVIAVTLAAHGARRPPGAVSSVVLPG